MKMKPFGVMLGLLGNVMIALAIGKLIETGSCGGEFAPACPDELTPYFIMLPAGIIISVVAIFLGGGPVVFLGVFLAVGIGSLITGFSTESSEAESFAKIFGAAFVGVPLLLIVLMLVLGRAGAAKMARAQRLVATGARGVGTVTQVNDTGITINENPRVEVVMRVDPEDGSSPLELTKTVTVSRVSIPRVGDRFPVWYDRAEPSSWAYGTAMDPSQTPPDIQTLFAKAADDGPADELAKLAELKAKGVLTDAEFAAAKARLLS